MNYNPYGYIPPFLKVFIPGTVSNTGRLGLVPSPPMGAPGVKFLRDDGSWAVPSGTGTGGVTSVGPIDSQTPSADGLFISGTVIYAQSASTLNPGLVNNTTQSFSGAKTFNSAVLIAPNANQLVLGTTNTTSITMASLTSSRVVTFPDANSNTVRPLGSATASNWVQYINATGVQNLAQPAFSDISGTLLAAQFPALTGDVTTVAGALATTLATVNSNVGSFGSSTAIPNFTVNAKGLITAADSSAVIAPAGTLTGATLAANVLASSLTSVGILTSLAVSSLTASRLMASDGSKALSSVSDLSTWVTGTTNRIISTLNGSGGTAIDISSSYAGQATITILGTVATGTWSASTIAVNKGGTGQTSYTDGQLLIGNTSGNTLAKAALTQSSANQVIITNGAGSITLSLPQDINTTSIPTFKQIGLGGAPSYPVHVTGNPIVITSLIVSDATLVTALANTSLYGAQLYNNQTFNSGATTCSAIGFQNALQLSVNTGSSVSTAIGANFLAPTNGGTGTSITKAQTASFLRPSIGTSINQSIYTDNLSVGYPSTDLGATNKVIIAGTLTTGASSASTAQFLVTPISSTQTIGISLTGAFSGAAQTGMLIANTFTNNTSTVGVAYSAMPIFATATATTLAIAACFQASPRYTGNVNVISDSYGFWYDGGLGAVGTITRAYGGFFQNPASGLSRQALYSENLSVGYSAATVSLSGTNNAVFAGNVSIGASTFTQLFNVGTANQFTVNTTGFVKTTAGYQSAIATSGGGSVHYFMTIANNAARMSFALGDVESSGNAGSNFILFSYADNGALLDVPFKITRSNSLASFSGNVEIYTVGKTFSLISGTGGMIYNNILLSSGSATVANTNITANHVPTGITRVIAGALPGIVTVTITPGVGFVMASTSATDNGTLAIAFILKS